MPLTVTSNQEGPSYNSSIYAMPIYFAEGTKIATPAGEVAVEDLKAGDLVLTAEGVPEPLRWIGSRGFPAKGRLARVAFAPGTIGNTRTPRVSRQHLLLLTGWRAELYFGAEEVWVPAVHFRGRKGFRVESGGTLTFYHQLLDGHLTPRADGAEAESLHPGDVALCSLDCDTLAEVLEIFPELLQTSGSRPMAHPSLRAVEARVAFAA